MVLAGTIGGALMAGVFTYGFQAFFVPLTQELGAGRAALAGAISLASLEGGALGPAQGWLVDHFGPRRMKLVGIAIMGTGFIFLSRIDSLLQFYLVFVLLIGLWSGLAFNQTIFTAVAYWFVRKRGRALGLTLGGIGLGGFIVPVVAFMIGHFGWRGASMLCGFLVWVVGVPVAFVMRRRPEIYGLLPDGEATPSSAHPAAGQDDEEEYSVVEALRTPAFWLVSITWAFRSFLVTTIATHFIPFLEDRGFTRQVAANFVAVMAVVSIVGRLGFGSLGDRFPKSAILVISNTTMACAVFVLVLTPSLWGVVLFVLVYGPTQGGGAPLLYSLVGDFFGRRNYGTIQGYVSVVLLVGTVGGPVLAGYLFDITGSYRVAFLLMAILAMVAAVLSAFLRRPRKHPRQPQEA